MCNYNKIPEHQITIQAFEAKEAKKLNLTSLIHRFSSIGVNYSNQFSQNQKETLTQHPNQISLSLFQFF